MTGHKLLSMMANKAYRALHAAHRAENDITRSKQLKTILGILILLSICTIAWAGSPADPTLFFRRPKAEMIKLGDDINSKWVWATKPMTKNVSIAYYGWESENGKKLAEYALTVKTSPTTQIGLVADDWNKGEDRTSFMLDTTVKRMSLAALIPIDDAKKATVGLRYKMSTELTAYGKFCDGSKPLLGISYSKAVTVDLAYGSKVTYVRVSKSFGRITPEARLRFSEAENFYGGAICLRFN